MRVYGLKICVCGGGNLAHAIVGELGNSYDISVLTRSPQKWSKEIILFHEGESSISHISQVTDDKNVLKNADVILITLPANVRVEYLKSIKDYVSDTAIIVTMPSIAGINFVLDKIFPNNAYACFQRVPYICRTLEYGHSVKTEPKSEIEIYFSKNTTTEQKQAIKDIFNIPCKELSSYWTLFLSNSNPIIHIARLCEILNNYPAKQMPLFYECWGDYASRLAVSMDRELTQVMKACGETDFRDLLTHYGVNNEIELTKKINNIPSFKGITSPMIETEEGFVLDKTSRYLTEDLPFGTCFIKYFAQKFSIDTPNIDYAIKTIQNFIDKKLVNGNKLDVSILKDCIGYDIELLLTL